MAQNRGERRTFVPKKGENMKTSENIRKFIKNFEGLRLNAYLCPARVWTIGYGHTGSEVKKGLVITKEQAEKYFREDVAIHENNVSRLVKVPLTQNRFDALVSFEYNVGYGNFANSTLLRLLNAKKYAQAAEQFTRWVYTTVSVNGKPKSVALSGLVNRRKREKEIFLNGF